MNPSFFKVLLMKRFLQDLKLKINCLIKGTFLLVMILSWGSESCWSNPTLPSLSESYILAKSQKEEVEQDASEMIEEHMENIEEEKERDRAVQEYLDSVEKNQGSTLESEETEAEIETPKKKGDKQVNKKKEKEKPAAPSP